MKKLLIVFAFVTVPLVALAHSGGTDGAGCHTDHSTGGYHCHRR